VQTYFWTTAPQENGQYFRLIQYIFEKIISIQVKDNLIKGSSVKGIRKKFTLPPCPDRHTIVFEITQDFCKKKCGSLDFPI